MFIVIVTTGQRTENSPKVQTVLSRNGDIIKTRLGLNRELTNEKNALGVIIMEICGDEQRTRELCNDLNAIDGIKAQYLKIELPSGCCCS
jgi:hypothetical protein